MVQDIRTMVILYPHPFENVGGKKNLELLLLLNNESAALMCKHIYRAIIWMVALCFTNTSSSYLLEFISFFCVFLIYL